MNALKDLKLLSIEDQNLLRRAVGDLLDPYCGELLFAADGREALDILPRLKPDLVLTDIIMPTMDGIRLKTDFFYRHAFCLIPNERKAFFIR